MSLPVKGCRDDRMMASRPVEKTTVEMFLSHDQKQSFCVKNWLSAHKLAMAIYLQRLSGCLLCGVWLGERMADATPHGPAGPGEAIANIEALTPRVTSIVRNLATRVFDLEPGCQSEGCDAFAIWMPGAKQGFMSDTKRPAAADRDGSGLIS